MKKYFYGQYKTGPYFEGWYFKCQTGEGYSIGVIPAFHIRKDGQKSASIQVITPERTWWLEYPASSFSASVSSFQIRIDGNWFSQEGMQLDLEQEGLSLHGKIGFGSFRSLRSDIMGPFRWFANMECAHSVISMGHTLHGRMELNGEILDFSGGTGYIEADRGRSFPAEYLWTQCSWEGCSVMLSVATIPLGWFHFTGCICAIIHNGQEYRLATYQGAKVEKWSAQGAVLRQGKYRLEVQLIDQNARPLRAPTEGSMNRIIHESLNGKVRYSFWQDEVRLFTHITDRAGYEYAAADAEGNHAVDSWPSRDA